MRIVLLAAEVSLSLWFVGCAEAPVTLTDPDLSASDEPVDLRREFPPPPEGGLQLVTPTYEVPPHTEVQLCVAVPYDGPTMGIRTQHTYQSPGGHHVTVNGTTATPTLLPDGEAVDCAGASTDIMVSTQPIFIGGDPVPDTLDGPEYALTLPDGMAARMPLRTRILLQSHYINTTSSPILVHDAVNLELVPEEEVEVWAAPFALSESDELSVPVGLSTTSFDCVVEEPVSVLFLGGHMHEWGASFQTLRNGEVLYDVPDWDPIYRDAPLYANLGDGLELAAGDVLTTRCSYDNDTDHTLTFPEEMCVTFSMVYPAKIPVICDP